MWIINKVIKKNNINKIYFTDLSYEWLKSKEDKIKKATYLNYKYIIDKYLNPSLKNISLKELEDFDFNLVVNKLGKKLAPKTTKDIVTILKSILNFILDNYDLKINVKLIKSPKQSKKPLEVLTKSEQQKIEKYCIKENSLKNIGILICLNTGIRIGEICALKWENIDLERRELRIRKTIERVYDSQLKTSIIIDNPKTQNSVRDIPISNKLFSLLYKIRKNYEKDDYFLTGKSNQFIEPGNYRMYFNKILKKLKIKNKYKFHILRHTFATNCINIGMDIKSLSEILGHSNVEITLNKYVHSSYETKKKFLEKL